MSTAGRWAGGERPLVDRVARNISDPVLRLRFLKAVGPPIVRTRRRWSRPWRRIGLVALAAIVIAPILLIATMLARARHHDPVRTPPRPAAVSVPAQVPNKPAATDVWLVERTGELSTYSNGLRIDDRFLVSTHPRSYHAFPVNGSAPERREQPAGIVFHTTESRQAPFEAKANRALRRIGESLLEYIRRKQAYNFVIDRFGRVYRIVPEEQIAKHAGYSAWADEKWQYVNLNESFVGISFEAVSPGAEENAGISPAQTSSAAMLIEMLRHRYPIPAANCVTHAQVSVNPSNMRVGLHVDWAAGFPFEAVGLPDNYAAALPALWAFGLDYDPAYLSKAGAGIRTGIERAEAIVSERAAASGVRPAEYKKRLRRVYRELLDKVHQADPHTGSADDLVVGKPSASSALQFPDFGTRRC
jgi:N-acetylmuramoyl-L-alanine amidase